MILRLVRTQLRSEWKSTLLGVGTLALALTLATFSMLVTATRIAHWADHPLSFESLEEHAGYISSTLDEPTREAPLNGPISGLSPEEISQLVVEASAYGPVEATAETEATIQGTDGIITILIPMAGSMSSDYLAVGDEPGSGEIALNQGIAARFSLEIGDSLTLESIHREVPSSPVSLTISGLILDGNASPYDAWTPQAIASWEDFEAIQRSLPFFPIVDSTTGDVTLLVSVNVSWSGDNPILLPYYDFDSYHSTGQFSWIEASNSLSNTTGWTLLSSGIILTCLIAASLSMGRAQAETRTRWSATARVLGASSRTIAAASLVETTIVSVLGVFIGLGAGIGLANLHLLYLKATHPNSILPPSISVPAEILILGAVVGLGLAIVLAAIPAFWASRVAPVAALKPVTPVSEATLSRPVRWWWPLAIAAMGVVIAGIVIRIGLDSTGVETVSRFGAGVVIVAGAALLIQIARGLVTVTGKVLSRSRRAWMLAGGDGILTHRRAFTFASLGTLVTGGVASWWIASSASTAFEWNETYRGWGELPLLGLGDWWRLFVADAGTPVFTAVAFAVVAFVAVVVAASFRQLESKDDSVRGALGLSRRSERLAVGTRQASVMSVGAITGALGGCALAILYRLFLAVLSPNHLVYSLQWNFTLIGHALVGAAAIAAIGLVFALFGGLMTALVAGPPRFAVATASH